VNAQAAALEFFAQGKGQDSRANDEPSKEKQKRHHSRSRRKEHRAYPGESRPAAQIAKNSYLGKALQNVGRRRHAKHRDESPSYHSSEPSDTPEDSDYGSDDSDESSTSNSTRSGDQGPSRHRKRRENRHGRNKKRRRSSAGSSRSTLKPIPPLEYDGKPDARAYHRFVQESGAYLRDGKVKGSRRVFLLSYYLTGRAYDFYTQKVSIDEESWSLRHFYAELFNYCFPVDFRMQMRRELARCHQNESTVSEYVHELQELFNMIGDIPDRDKVLKFWNSSRAIIQKGLWRDNLNPEISTWDQVVSQAEIIEISENVAERRDRRTGFSQPSGSNEGTSRSRGQMSNRSARAVTFESPRRPHGHDRHQSRAKTPHGPRDRSHQPSTSSRQGSRPPGRGSNHGGRRDHDVPRRDQPRQKFQPASGSTHRSELVLESPVRSG
jgi:hypothetical protein